MTTQNQNPQNPNAQNQDKNKAPQDSQAQARKDDMENTGAQAKTGETAGKDANRDVQQGGGAAGKDQQKN